MQSLQIALLALTLIAAPSAIVASLVDTPTVPKLVDVAADKLAKAEAPASVLEKVVEESDEEEDDEDDDDEACDDEADQAADQASGTAVETTIESVLESSDKNNDGKLSTDEIFVQEDGMTPEQKENREVMSAKFRKTILPKVDTNGDSLISKEEFPSFLQWQQHAVTHRQLDANGDGKLSEEEVLKPMINQKPKELQQMMFHFQQNLKKIDTDGDSLISLDEMPALVASSEEFATKRRNLENDHLLHDLDENRDGKLSREEIFKQHIKNRPNQAKRMLEHFDDNLQYIDTDGDSLISVAEMPALIALSAEYEQKKKVKKACKANRRKAEKSEDDLSPGNDAENENDDENAKGEDDEDGEEEENEDENEDENDDENDDEAEDEADDEDENAQSSDENDRDDDGDDGEKGDSAK